ncbi:MAG TPA: amino acid adenylation domain-containing protein [Syntrophomonadaceae bacterium]|nr:amino acid adenylation domain-containing protein [Syntrophomonadaceae bacterium]HPR92661.1 amino acid adenylation domain-containing protein [Syntrophomonadaceae bacterium]
MKSKTFYPLTHPQKGIWYTEKFYPSTGIANIIGVMRLNEGLDFDVLKEAINYIIANNDSMRIRICELPTGPVQYVADHFEHEIRMLDFSNADDSITSFFNWVDKERRIPIPANNSDLFEFVIFKLGKCDGGFFLKTHHIISDAWTMILIGNQINDYYFRLLKGTEPIASYYSSYIDYIESEQKFCTSAIFEENRRFWNDRFNTVPELTTLRPNKQAFGSCEANRKTFTISREFTIRLTQFSEDLSVSLFILFLSALTICLQKILDSDDIIIGTPLLNRPTIKEKTTMGMFIETIPVRLKVDSSLTFEAFILQVAKDWREMRNHRYPYNLLLEDIRKEHKLISNLYDIMLSFQNAHFDLNLGFETFYSASGSEANSICFHISDRDNIGELYVDVDYQIALFEEAEIESLYSCIFAIIDTALRNPAEIIANIPLISNKEKEYVLNTLNNTKISYRDNTLVHALFEEQVIKTPDAIAIEFNEQKLTYKELNEKANRLARCLQAQGVKPGSIVSLLLERSCDLPISIWAVLKAGGAYLPLDPDYPSDRIKYILEDSNSLLVLTSESLQEKVKGYTCLLADKIITDSFKDTNLSVQQTSSDLAYVIYTSGSTGKPKGVMIEHKSVCNFFTAMARQVDLQNKRVLSVTTVCFDIFVFEFFYPMVNGNTVIIADKNQQLNPGELCRLIMEKRINIIQTTPSRMQLLLLDDSLRPSFADITDIILGGEAFPLSLLEQLKKITNARIINGYGPTEATVYSTFKDLTDGNKITIGKPVANTRAYIMDKNHNLLPANIIGELYIGGAGLARGYLNQEELTGERFIPSPLDPSQRIYRTGDLAKWNSDGEIEFLGRADYQVKIRGYRIELGEIESILMQHEQITEAVVIDREDENHDQYLCAYLKVNGDLNISDIRFFAGRILPEYMIPTAYIFMEEMPLNANGKIDRRHLAAINNDEFMSVQTIFVEPRNEEEFILAAEWSKILNRDNIGIDDNFFDLGGDSLKIVRILVALLPHKWDLTARDFYKYQTIRKLSEKIKGGIDSYKEEDYLKKDIAVIPNSVKMQRKLSECTVNNMHNILLTGATGFLGAHLLKDLLLDTDANIYCIVRGSSAANARTRLKKVLDFHFPDQLSDEIGKRIKIVHGDINLEMWGLSVKKYNQLQKIIDTVFHTAAKVSHYGSYSEFEKVNVWATQKIIGFCLNNDKMLHYISSISVSGKYLVIQDRENSIFSENDFYIGQHFYDNVYVRSKFEAENLILKAIQLGLRAAIYRLGVLAGRYSDGHFQMNIKDNAMYNRIRSIILTEVIPQDFIDMEIELTPIDYCSKAIVLLSGINFEQGQIFHLYNHNIIKLPQLIKAAEICGYRLKIKKGRSYDKYVQKIFLDPVKRDYLTGIINDVNINRTIGMSESPMIVSTKTKKYLHMLGFKWPKPDIPYLVKVLKYMEFVEFISYDKSGLTNNNKID